MCNQFSIVSSFVSAVGLFKSGYRLGWRVSLVFSSSPFSLQFVVVVVAETILFVLQSFPRSEFCWSLEYLMFLCPSIWYKLAVQFRALSEFGSMFWARLLYRWGWAFHQQGHRAWWPLRWCRQMLIIVTWAQCSCAYCGWEWCIWLLCNYFIT